MFKLNLLLLFCIAFVHNEINCQLITSQGSPLLVFQEPNSEPEKLRTDYPDWLKNVLNSGNLRKVSTGKNFKEEGDTGATTYIAFEDPNSDPNDPLTFVVIEPSLTGGTPNELPPKPLKLPQPNTVQLSSEEVNELLKLTTSAESHHSTPSSGNQGTHSINLDQIVRVPDITFSVPLDKPESAPRLRSVPEHTGIPSRYYTNSRTERQPHYYTLPSDAERAHNRRSVADLNSINDIDSRRQVVLANSRQDRSSIVVELDPSRTNTAYSPYEYSRPKELEEPEPLVLSLQEGSNGRTKPILKLQSEIKAVPDDVLRYLRGERSDPVTAYAQPIVYDPSGEKSNGEKYEYVEPKRAISTNRYEYNPPHYFDDYAPAFGPYSSTAGQLQEQVLEEPRFDRDREIERQLEFERRLEESVQARQKLDKDIQTQRRLEKSIQARRQLEEDIETQRRLEESIQAQLQIEESKQAQPNWRYFHEVVPAPAVRPTAPTLGPYTLPFPPNHNMNAPVPSKFAPDELRLLLPQERIPPSLPDYGHSHDTSQPRTKKYESAVVYGSPAPPVFPPSEPEQITLELSHSRVVGSNREPTNRPPSSYPRWYNQEADFIQEPYPKTSRNSLQSSRPTSPATGIPGDYSFEADSVKRIESDREAKDLHRYCCFWAKHKQCRTNADWMLLNCKLACSTAGCAGCEDDDEHCGYWAAANQCHTNPDFMHFVCRLSCNACTSPFNKKST